MKEKVGTVFSVAKDNPTVEGCTVSKEIYCQENYIAYYSLAENTDISAEMYPYHKLLIINSGSIEVYYSDKKIKCVCGESILTPTEIPVGIRTQESSIYTEISIRGNDIMNQSIKPGEAFKLADKVPYQEGKIVNMDVVHNEKMKLVVMSFDAGTGLSEHAAPGEALIFALDGEAVIGYEGESYTLKAGENFHFAKGGKHFVKATEKFKMALLLTLE